MMWPSNKLTEKLGIALSLIQAPMAGGATTPELVAAVSNAGGLGSFGAGYMQPEAIRTTIRKIRTLTDKPFAVNLFIPEEYVVNEKQIEEMKEIITHLCHGIDFKISDDQPPYSPSFEKQIEIILEENIPVFSFSFGVLEKKYIEMLHNNKTLLIGTATNLAEATLLQESGIDMIAAQGCEAGGHRGTFLSSATDGLIGLMALLPQLVDHINVPVIAAGGIMDARGIVAALALGAAGVQMGTAFLCCHESGVHPEYKKKLLQTIADNTVLTRAFSGKMVRGIKNEFSKRMLLYENEILDYPIQNKLTRFMRIAAETKGDTNFMSMWAGQAAYLSQEISAAELVEQLNHAVVLLFAKISKNFSQA